MSTKDNFDNLFEGLKGQFDLKEPNNGHQSRFLEKLEANTGNNKKSISKSFWKTFLAIAASLVISLTIFGVLNTDYEVTDLASVSSELSEKQDFFTVSLQQELKKLDAERSPLTENIIYHALRQIKVLEKDYENLKNDLNKSGSDDRVIYAMITNYQTRIDVLKDVLNQIGNIKKLKNSKNETTNTL